MNKISFEYNGKKKNIKIEKSYIKIYDLNGFLEIFQYDRNEPEPRSIGNLVGSYEVTESGVIRKI